MDEVVWFECIWKNAQDKQAQPKVCLLVALTDETRRSEMSQ